MCVNKSVCIFECVYACVHVCVCVSGEVGKGSSRLVFTINFTYPVQGLISVVGVCMCVCVRVHVGVYVCE